MTETLRREIRAAMVRHLCFALPSGALAVAVERAVDDVVRAVEKDTQGVSEAVGGTIA